MQSSNSSRHVLAQRAYSHAALATPAVASIAALPGRIANQPISSNLQNAQGTLASSRHPRQHTTQKRPCSELHHTNAPSPCTFESIPLHANPTDALPLSTTQVRGGLMNPGTTYCCWLNATLQALISSPALRELIRRRARASSNPLLAAALLQLQTVVDAIAERCACTGWLFHGTVVSKSCMLARFALVGVLHINSCADIAHTTHVGAAVRVVNFTNCRNPSMSTRPALMIPPVI